MDRRGQLRNVAFGGAWSEQIAGTEELLRALEMLDVAVLRTADEDLREDPALAAALQLVCETHPKARDLMVAWDKGLRLSAPQARANELHRVANILRSGVLERLR